MERFLLPSKENNVQSVLDNHFGKSRWYLIVNAEGELIKAIPGDQNSHHTGIYRVKEELKFSTILTPHMGPHAFEIAQKRGLEIYMVSSGITVLDAIRQYKKGKLELLDTAENLSCGGPCH